MEGPAGISSSILKKVLAQKKLLQASPEARLRQFCLPCHRGPVESACGALKRARWQEERSGVCLQPVSHQQLGGFQGSEGGRFSRKTLSMGQGAGGHSLGQKLLQILRCSGKSSYHWLNASSVPDTLDKKASQPPCDVATILSPFYNKNI